jgi:hypothetical protein
MNVALIARVPFDFHGRPVHAGDLFDASGIETVILRTRGVATFAPKTRAAIDPRNPPMTRCRFCKEAVDDCGGFCRGARDARNDPNDHKSRAFLDATQAAEANQTPAVDDSQAPKPKRKYQRRDLTAEE